jgi:hypothetical protein
MSTLPTRRLWVNALITGALGWLYGGDVGFWFRARGAEVAAASTLPSVGFAAVALAGVLGAAGVSAWGVWTKKDNAFKGYRLVPVVALVALFLDLFVLGGGRSPFPSHVQVRSALQSLADSLAEAPPESVTDAQLQAWADLLGRPPYLVRGEPVPRYTVRKVFPCEGPVTTVAPGDAPGTVLACLQAGGGVLTVVGLPAGTRFGASAVITVNGEPLAVHWSTTPVSPTPEAPPARDDSSDAGPL